jgi:ribosomal-protein-alanine N-acetyltransferase
MQPITPIIETSRLWLRPLELADGAQAQLLFPQWEIVRYLTNTVPWPYPADGAHTFYRDVALPAMQRGDAWHWSLRPKSSPEQMIGSIGLMTNENENRGFWLGMPWQGQGFMTEACDAATSFWFDVLGFPALRIWKAVANTPSRRISMSQCMRVIDVQERNYVIGRASAELWEITAEEWRAKRQRNA